MNKNPAMLQAINDSRKIGSELRDILVNNYAEKYSIFSIFAATSSCVIDLLAKQLKIAKDKGVDATDAYNALMSPFFYTLEQINKDFDLVKGE